MRPNLRPDDVGVGGDYPGFGGPPPIEERFACATQCDELAARFENDERPLHKLTVAGLLRNAARILRGAAQGFGEPPGVRRVVLWAQDLETVLESIFAVSDDDRSHAENEVLYEALGMMRRELKAAVEALPVELRESITAMVRRGLGGERAAGEGT